MNSAFGRTFLFLTDLAWKSRITLPVLITAGFMIMNFRWEVEINIHTERIAMQRMDDGQGGGGGGGGRGGGGGGARAGGVAAIDYSLEESWETTDDSDEDEDDDVDDGEDDETDYDEDSDDDEIYSDDEGGDDEVRRIALVTF
ncbi:uncharacterized protein LOC115256421 [Aedes albopictus]|uniref:Uncharacterized protein n=1 Tax=Aedes albopictus TaxID=7160 RepID=A0ABM1YE37_AEDAL